MVHCKGDVVKTLMYIHDAHHEKAVLNDKDLKVCFLVTRDIFMPSDCSSRNT